jgi:hypothetical protein
MREFSDDLATAGRPGRGSARCRRPGRFITMTRSGAATFRALGRSSVRRRSSRVTRLLSSLASHFLAMQVRVRGDGMRACRSDARWLNPDARECDVAHCSQRAVRPHERGWCALRRAAHEGSTRRENVSAKTFVPSLLTNFRDTVSSGNFAHWRSVVSPSKEGCSSSKVRLRA